MSEKTLTREELYQAVMDSHRLRCIVQGCLYLSHTETCDFCGETRQPLESIRGTSPLTPNGLLNYKPKAH